MIPYFASKDRIVATYTGLRRGAYDPVFGLRHSGERFGWDNRLRDAIVSGNTFALYQPGGRFQVRPYYGRSPACRREYFGKGSREPRGPVRRCLRRVFYFAGVCQACAAAGANPYGSDGFALKMHLSSIANTSFAFFTMRSLPCLSRWLYRFATLPDTLGTAD